MKPYLLALSLIVCTVSVQAQEPARRLSCEDLRAKIEANLKERGVEKYALAVLKNEEVGDAKVIGSCDGGTRKVVYKRG